MSFQIEAIFSTPMASGPMEPKDEATLLQGIGLEGDRYACKQGTYSVLRASKLVPGQAEPGRQLTLISAAGVQNSFQQQGLEWNKPIGDLRRNIVLQNISSQELLDLVGSTLQLGEDGAKVFIHRNCVPCMYNERRNKTPGLMEALWESGGVSCEVVESGKIRVGDKIEVLSEEKREIDEGFQPSGFFVRPSKRSATMVREALAGKKKSLETLLAADPGGVARAHKSYDSVGLKFWPTLKESDLPVAN